MENNLKESLIQIGTKTAESLGYEIVEVNVDRKSKPMILDFIVFHKNGVKIDDCATISHGIEKKLDEKDVIKDRYLLQVSSPGLDRPIKTQDDFRRNIGNKVEVNTYVKVENKKEFIGVLANYNEKEIELILEEDSTIQIPIDVIAKMNQFIEF